MAKLTKSDLKRITSRAKKIREEDGYETKEVIKYHMKWQDAVKLAAKLEGVTTKRQAHNKARRAANKRWGNPTVATMRRYGVKKRK